MSDERAFTPEVERFLAGELSEAEARAIEEKLGSDELERLARIHRTEQAELVRGRPPEQFAQLVRARASVENRSRARTRTWATGLAVAAAAMLIWALPSERMPTQHPSSEERIKGMKPELLVYRRAPSGVEDLKRGARVRAHDTLQLAYVAAGYAHGVILSIDGAGAVTLHSPRSEEESDSLAPSGRHMLDTSYELDAAPSYERFFFVVSEHPIAVREVVEAARSLAKLPERARQQLLPLPVHYVQVTFELEKNAP